MRINLLNLRRMVGMEGDKEDMETQETKDVLHRRVKVEVKREMCCLSLVRGGDVIDAQELTFDGVRQLIFELEGTLFEIARIRRGK